MQAILFFFIDGYLVQGPPGTYQAKRASIHVTLRMRASINNPGADPGFFLGGGALVSCSSSTPINHIALFFFFAEYQLY